MEARWNHNIHHHPVVPDAVPSGARVRRHLLWRHSITWTTPT